MAAGLAGFLPARTVDAPGRRPDRGVVGGTGGAVVPSAVADLAAHGGVPGAAAPVLVRAFGLAFDALRRAGGGTLLVPAGVYDFGPRARPDPVVLVRDARDIAISAYGALFRAETSARVMPSLFYFFNYSNVTIAGASFEDRGFTPWVDWQGMYCVGLQADAASEQFRMVDCHADRVLGLLASNNNPATRRYMAGLSVHGEVRNAYYGVGASFIREGVAVDLVCHNVRRAFIANALRDADIGIDVNCTQDWPGSNGLVALVSGGASMGDVEQVRVRVRASGACIHASYVHFYHQGPERHGSMRDIDATVDLFHVDGARNLFSFDHEDGGIRTRTARVWDRIELHGAVAGPFGGRVLSNPSRSESPGIVLLDRNLGALAGPFELAPHFRVRAE
ncbi:conserved hypothetical protein [Massilia sp. 9I]|nr:conserved hypothetical protein [Massilia sp. 9I]